MTENIDNKDDVKKINRVNTKIKHNEGVSDTILGIAYAFLLAVFIRSFLYEPFHIPSGSMKPNLLEGDYIVVSKFEYGYSRYSIPFGLPIIKDRIFDYKKPQRGDVIVFRLPSNPKINYIKRLIGLPGDTIVVKNDILYINGEKIERKYINEYFDEFNSKYLQMYNEKLSNKKDINILQDNAKIIRDGDGEFIVPDNYYFFIGDNRDNSLDSRFIETGFIPYENIVGKAKIIFFSKNDSLFKFWKLYKTIRFNRIFKVIK